MKLIRDEWGVPHIAAETETEAFRTVGYLQAEDNLPRMLRLYTVLHVRAAANFGADWVAVDRSQQRWRHLPAARRQLQRLSERDQALYTAFMEGIRAYRDEHPDELPELQPEL